MRRNIVTVNLMQISFSMVPMPSMPSRVAQTQANNTILLLIYPLQHGPFCMLALLCICIVNRDGEQRVIYSSARLLMCCVANDRCCVYWMLGVHTYFALPVFPVFVIFMKAHSHSHTTTSTTSTTTTSRSTVAGAMKCELGYFFAQSVRGDRTTAQRFSLSFLFAQHLHPSHPFRFRIALTLQWCMSVVLLPLLWLVFDFDSVAFDRRARSASNTCMQTVQS